MKKHSSKKPEPKKVTPRGLPTLDRLAERLNAADLWKAGKNLTEKDKAERRPWFSSRE